MFELPRHDGSIALGFALTIPFWIGRAVVSASSSTLWNVIALTLDIVLCYLSYRTVAGPARQDPTFGAGGDVRRVFFFPAAFSGVLALLDCLRLVRALSGNG